ncbi:glycosyltransferase family A protein [Mycoplasmoides alvi]|uniref:glycosyltransferase family A protein n=1 Tax=Mycoplasmoides alvi TaxID=78580 RepID=UPI00051B48F3|nr:glycosyltransferase family 2 protein [Mycoplasmoides alvi]
MKDFAYTFTIIIPTYNAAFYLKSALDSILNQTFDKKQIQVLVIDDGSIDNTKLIIQQYQNKCGLLIEYFYKNNKNWGSVINYVKKQKLAKGKYVTILDADDVYFANALELINNINKNNIDLIIADFKKRKDYISTRIYTYSYFVKYPNKKYQMQTPFCVPIGKFLSNELFYKIPYLRENLFYQDAIFTAYAINCSSNIFHLNKPIGTYNYKRIGNSMSLPWNENRYLTEIDICLELIKLDAQEIAAIHIIRNKFRKLLKENLYTFHVIRKFNFSFFPWSTRWIMYVIYFLILKKYFIIES